MPAMRRPVGRSERSIASANSATKIGTDPFSTPASDDAIHCWPTVISVIGMAIWTTPVTTSGFRWLRSAPVAPDRIASGQTVSAPSVTRDQTIMPGLSSRSAISLNR